MKLLLDRGIFRRQFLSQSTRGYNHMLYFFEDSRLQDGVQLMIQPAQEPAKARRARMFPVIPEVSPMTELSVTNCAQESIRFDKLNQLEPAPKADHFHQVIKRSE